MYVCMPRASGARSSVKVGGGKLSTRLAVKSCRGKIQLQPGRHVSPRRFPLFSTRKYYYLGLMLGNFVMFMKFFLIDTDKTSWKTFNHCNNQKITFFICTFYRLSIFLTPNEFCNHDRNTLICISCRK